MKEKEIWNLPSLAHVLLGFQLTVDLVLHESCYFHLMASHFLSSNLFHDYGLKYNIRSVVETEILTQRLAGKGARRWL